MLDGQGCLLPVRHFHHQEDPPPLILSSWPSLYFTCRAEAAVDTNPAAVDTNPADTHTPSFIRSIVAGSSVSEAETEVGQISDGYGELPLPPPVRLPVPNLQAVEAGTSQACNSHGDLASHRSTSPSRSVQAGSPLPTVGVGTQPASHCKHAESEVTKVTGRSTHFSRSAGAASGGKVPEVERFPEADLALLMASPEDGETGLPLNEQTSKANENLMRSGYADEDTDKPSIVKGPPEVQEQTASLATNPNISEEGKTEFISRVSASEEGSSSQTIIVDSQGWKRQRIESDTTDLYLKNMVLENGTLSAKSCYSHNDGSSDQQQPVLPGLDDESALRCLAFVHLSDLGRLAMTGRQYRDLVKGRTIFNLRRMYGMVEHLVFIYTSGAGGWQAYDANRNVWRTLPPANVNPAFDLSDRESLSAGTHVLWLGKEMFEFVYYRYDLLSNSWERGPSMVNPRCLFASASCGEFAFVAGGFGPDNRNGDQISALRLLNSAERYNSLTGEWEPLPPMSTPRHKCSGFFMDGKFYVIGGRDANHQPIMSGEEYNPATRTWRTIENMYFAPEVSRRDMFEPSPPLVAVVNNELYAVESSTNILKVYNKQTNTWRNLGYLPVRADLRNGWGVAFKSLGDRLFVMGDVEGILACCWRPGPNATEPVWQLLCQRERGTNSFLYNCAVMAC